MMKLKIEGQWECFTQAEYELADFSIITGLNGVGKTRLLSSLSNSTGPESIIKIFDELDIQILSPKFYPITSFSPSISNSIGYSSVESHSSKNPISGVTSMYYIINRHRNGKPIPMHKGFQNVANKLNKSVYELGEFDILDNYKLADGLPEQDALSLRIGEMVGFYAQLKHDNSYDRFENEVEGKATAFLNDYGFIAKYGEDPTLTFNELLKSCGLPYEIETYKEHRGKSYTVYFKNILTNVRTTELKLSSGEQVILALGLAAFNIDKGNTYPVKLLLLDEPDASLHPSMTKRLLETILDVFIKNGIKVIMTTHSPSTIALAPDSAKIYLLDRQPTKLTTLTADQAISRLSVGIPTLSVKIENRRIVFTESKFDALILSKVYNYIKTELNSEFSLDFVSSGMGGDNTGNCQQVKHLARGFFENKIANAFGLIDFDNGNESTDNLVVLGSRYSIENYIYDPLPLAIYLLRKKILKPADFGLREGFPFWLIAGLANEQLQVVANKIIEIITPAIQGNIIESLSETKISYFNNCEIHIPDWYFTIQGHALEEGIKATFKRLEQEYRNEGSLKLDIVSNVFEEIPGLIPKDIIDTLYKLLEPIY